MADCVPIVAPVVADCAGWSQCLCVLQVPPEGARLFKWELAIYVASIDLCSHRDQYHLYPEPLPVMTLFAPIPKLNLFEDHELRLRQSLQVFTEQK